MGKNFQHQATKTPRRPF